MDDPLFAGLFVAVGAVLGFLSSLALARTQHRHALTLRIADEYFKVRRELVEVVSELTDLKLREEINQERRIHYRDAVAKIFYRNFDLLPKPVLEALILLHVSLEHPSLGPFELRDDTVISLSPERIAAFVERCNMLVNMKFVTPMALKSSNNTIRANQIIKLHARHVLHVLSEFSSVNQLAVITRLHRA